MSGFYGGIEDGGSVHPNLQQVIDDFNFPSDNPLRMSGNCREKPPTMLR